VASDNRVIQSRQLLAPSGKDKSIASEIKWRITTVDRAMVVRTDQHEVCERVISAPTEPTDVMSFA
jgi:hypothetical protein